ncbi:MAG: HAD family phosphatase [Clostridia bacterium]|nr:HAD family phosphatase [Clostridia bacterium]
MKDLSLNDLREYDALIFDLDGTILDSMEVWNEVDEIFLGKRGFKVDKEYTDTVKRCSMTQSAEYTVKRYNLKETPEEVIAEWEATVEEEYRSNIKLKKGAMEFLKAARDKGLKIACATALNRKNAVNSLSNNEVLSFFENVTTLEDLGHEVNKSDPSIFLLVSEKLKVDPSKCLVFEDVLGAIEGAKKGGFDTVIVYDRLSAGDYEKGVNTADFHIFDWTEVQS